MGEQENAFKSLFLINFTQSCTWSSTVWRSTTQSCCCSPQGTRNSQVCYSVRHYLRYSVKQCTGMNVWSSSRLSMSLTQRLSAPQSTRKTVSTNGRAMVMIRCGLQLLELARAIHMKHVLM